MAKIFSSGPCVQAKDIVIQGYAYDKAQKNAKKNWYSAGRRKGISSKKNSR